MVICFNCSQETKDVLDNLVKLGGYADYSQIISLAVGNLLVLEHEVSSQEVIVIDGVDRVPSKTRREESSNLVLPSHRASDITGKTAPIYSLSLHSIPAIFQSDFSNSQNIPMARVPSDVWSSGQRVPLNRWLFGQYNRLLPAKANCRALLHLLAESPKGVELADAIQSIILEAALLGDVLGAHDNRHNLARDERLSTAFPSAAEKSEKSYRRYSTQFLADVNKAGQLSGLLLSLKLINRAGSKATRLQLTEFGRDFAVLPNPVLDNQQENPQQKFSMQEKEFLIRHIIDNVPAEDFAFRTIIRAIQEGSVSPDSMDSFVQKETGVKPSSKVSAGFLSSQRSGAVSRMADLGLLTRVRKGVSVEYALTDSARNYFFV